MFMTSAKNAAGHEGEANYECVAALTANQQPNDTMSRMLALSLSLSVLSFCGSFTP